MHTPRVLSFSPSLFTPAAAKVGNLACFALLAGSLVGLAPRAHADDFNTVLGAGIGAVAGAAIGNSVGGRNGAVVGAGAGGLVGASLASQQQDYKAAPNHYAVVNRYHQPQPVTYYQQQPRPQYYQQQPVTYYQPHPQYYQPEPVTYYQPPPQYRVAQPVTYYQPTVVTWQVRRPQHPRYWRDERGDWQGHPHQHDQYRGHYNDYRR